MSQLAEYRARVGDRGVSQRSLAIEAGVHYRTIQQIEAGSEPTVRVAKAIAEALSRLIGKPVSIADLFEPAEVAS